MAPHSSTLAWKIPWTEEPGGLQSIGSLRVGHDWANSLSLFTFMHWRRKWQPTPVFSPGEPPGWRSLVGYSPWGREESDMTERIHFHFSLSCIGEGNGTPLRCSCLENPSDGGAWWPAVYGVAQSRTRLKRLSSSMPIIHLHIHNPYYTISERIYKTLTIVENGGGWWERKTYFSLYILSCFSFVPCTNITYSQLFSKKKVHHRTFPLLS